jgi:hypothetical protein
MICVGWCIKMRGQLEKKKYVRKKEETREKKRQRSRGSPFYLFFPFPRTISGSLVQFSLDRNQKLLWKLQAWQAN